MLLALLLACDLAVVKMDGDVLPVDADGDGFSVDAGDCDDTRADVAPGAEDTCDGVDQDCDGDVDEDGAQAWYADADGDGAGDPDDVVLGCAVEGRVPDGGDCDDADASVRPGAAEACNGEDDDCDGQIDEDAARTWYRDEDGDGFGDEQAAEVSCDVERDGWSLVAGDCDDGAAAVYPDRPEDCDALDNDCDGEVDEDVLVEWFADLDGDGWGSSELVVRACEAPSGHVARGGDCNEADGTVYPGATERCDADVDSNCDGSVSYADLDRDGVPACLDCDDTRADVRPGGTEVCGAADEDCDGAVDDADASLDLATASLWHPDADGDGFGAAGISLTRCDAPAGWRADANDCDDARATVNPVAAEVCNDLDDDCDGAVDDADGSLALASAARWYADDDSDGYGDATRSALQCDPPAGWASDATDCDDVLAAVNPGATEVCGGLDDDCDGAIDDADASLDRGSAPIWYGDVDGDGYGGMGVSVQQCSAPAGYLAAATDCNDGASGVNPSATETCNDTDDDCDGLVDDADPGRTGAGTWYRDADADGYGTSATTASGCDAPAGYVASGGDCNDGSGSVRPGATETCNASDDDCDGSVDSAAACGCAVSTYGGHTYLVCGDTSTWSTARDWCSARGYRLVSIGSAAENTFVTAQIVAAGLGSTWTGANDRSTETRWVWTSGEGWSYTNWNSGEPNNYFNEDCGELYSSGGWNDEDCGSTRPRVCETL